MDLLHLGALAQDGRKAVPGLQVSSHLEVPDLFVLQLLGGSPPCLAQPAHVQSVVYAAQEIIGVDRGDEEVIGPPAQGFHRGLHRRRGCDHENRASRNQILALREQVQRLDVGRREVQNDEVGGPRFDPCQGLLPRIHAGHLVSVLAQ